MSAADVPSVVAELPAEAGEAAEAAGEAVAVEAAAPSPGLRTRGGREVKKSSRALEAEASEKEAAAAKPLPKVESEKDTSLKRRDSWVFREERGSPKKRKALSATLKRIDGGSLGMSMDGLYVTAIAEGGVAATEGTIRVGDMVTEVNGKDTGVNGFACLLPKDKNAPIKLRLMRLITMEEAAEEALAQATGRLEKIVASRDKEVNNMDDPEELAARRKKLANALDFAAKAGLDSELVAQVKQMLDELPIPPEQVKITAVAEPKADEPKADEPMADEPMEDEAKGEA